MRPPYVTGHVSRRKLIRYVMQNNFNRGRADAYGEKQQCTYGNSDWFKIGLKQLQPINRKTWKKEV